ncbi:hypothetical protein VNO77_37781 [Canavalia gladiata]|uniref:Uncharacterized protein n=1 Tax=Canavalia gladiata TaxID=3824 RepID=A0AAN9KB59_CANGL
MIPRVGRGRNDSPMKTQLAPLEAREESALEDEFRPDFDEPTAENTSYILFLPASEGQFRATLQGTPLNELQLRIESGDALVPNFLITRWKRAFKVSQMEVVHQSLSSLMMDGKRRPMNFTKKVACLSWLLGRSTPIIRCNPKLAYPLQSPGAVGQ